jgi:hypothetical protein
MPSLAPLFLYVPPLGLTDDDRFLYNPNRPARHCGICGDSFQPELARCAEYDTDGEVRLAVDILIREWAVKHSSKHSEREHINHIKNGRLMSPDAAVRLIPLGIYPIDDLYYDDEIKQAGLNSPRAPVDDIPDR